VRPTLIKGKFCVQCVTCYGFTRTAPCEHCSERDPEGTPARREELARLDRVAKGMFTNIGRGMRLRVPHDPAEPAMIVKGMAIDPVVEYTVTREEVAFVLATKQLWRVPDHSETIQGWREHPKTKVRVPAKAKIVGAAESGFDFDKADWYCMVV